jgi:hypothetical protein
MRKYLIIFLWLISIPLSAQTPLLIEGQTYTNADAYWVGVTIPKTIPYALTFRNNSITSVNTSGDYMLNAGTDYSTGYENNLNGAVITGNKFDWNGIGSPWFIHGVYVGYNINTDFKYNYCDGAPFGIVLKSGDKGDGSSMTSTSGGCAYNIFKNNQIDGVIVKAINGVNIYNNTFYNSLSNIDCFIGVGRNNDSGQTYPWPHSENTKIKNNIFYSTVSDIYISVAESSLATLECDYNVYWCESGSHEPTFEVIANTLEYSATTYTWTQWKALGFDAHSVVVNPNFINTTDFVPTARLDYGTDLGTTWDDGLSTAATWIVDSSPTTEIQSGSWQVGSRVFATIWNPSPTAKYCATLADGGSDANPGTLASPWLTWNHAMKTCVAGDTVFFRGGVYPTTSTDASVGWGLGPTDGGTFGHRKVFMNYPGEVPIMDFSALTYSSYAWRYGMIFRGASHIKLIGLTWRNLFQIDGYHFVECVDLDWDGSIKPHDIIFDRCTVHNVGGVGWDSSRSDSLYFWDCDAYNCCDSIVAPGGHQGQYGSGFAVGASSSTTEYVEFKRCRAWNCSDQGFVTSLWGLTVIDSCWSFHNGFYVGDGNGFKLGYYYLATPIPIGRNVTHNIAAMNRHDGFSTNDDGYPSITGHFYNNTDFYTGHHPSWSAGGPNRGCGYVIYNTSSNDSYELERVFTNNISYWYEKAPTYVQPGASYTASYNSWQLSPSPVVADFVAVDTVFGLSRLLAPRKSDGSLPDLMGFLQLSSGSNLIDKGLDVGLPYSGLSPDLGAFEYETQIPSVEPAIITSVSVSAGTSQATTSFNITDDGGGTISGYGIEYNQIGQPVITIANMGSFMGVFAVNISPLLSCTNCRVRGFVTNEAGTGYSEYQYFTTTGCGGPAALEGDYLFSNGLPVFVGDQIVVYSPLPVTPPPPVAPYPAILDDTHTWGWYIADSISTITKDVSNIITEWADYLGSGHDLLSGGSQGDTGPLWTQYGVLFNGDKDNLKTATFPLDQPATVYIVFKQPTHKSSDNIFGGFVTDGADLYQTNPSPRIRMWAGLAGPYSDDLAENTWGIVTACYDGVSSTLQVDDHAEVTGNPGTNAFSGFSLGIDGTDTGYTSNIQVKEVTVRDLIDTAGNKVIIQDYLKRRNGLYMWLILLLIPNYKRKFKIAA